MSCSNNSNFLPYPKVPKNYSVQTLAVIKPEMAPRCYNLCVGNEAIFFSKDDCVWKVHPDGVIEEYARMKDGSDIAGIAFDHTFSLFVLTSNGVLIQIDENKKGRTIATLSTIPDVKHPIQMCDLSYASGVLCASIHYCNGSGILRLAPTGNIMWISRTPGGGTLGISVGEDKFVWSIESKDKRIVKRKPVPDAVPLTSINIDSLNLTSDDFREGRICRDENQKLYISTKDVILKLSDSEPTVTEPVAIGMKAVTGICYWKKALYILESGAARILELSRINCD